MERKDFLQILKDADHDYNKCLQITRKYLLHGIPYVFQGRETEYFEFRDKVAKYFKVSFHEIFIAGSAKLGFSYHKDSIFSLESDVDVIIVNERLFEEYYIGICKYQYMLDHSQIIHTGLERQDYNLFLKYLIKGWMRPDKLPIKDRYGVIKDEWFDFFDSISNEKSEVGNYEVAGGLFKNFSYLERYYTHSLLKVEL